MHGHTIVKLKVRTSQTND